MTHYRVVIDFHGNNQAQDALDCIDDVRQILMRRDPSDEPFIHIQHQNANGEWEEAIE